MSEVLIYHNPRCSKSRATLELLRERGIQPRIVEYLKQPPSAGEVREILERLQAGPRHILRSGEPEYAASGLDDPDLADAALIAAIVSHPILLERPIVLANGKAAIGRPPEKVLDIL